MNATQLTATKLDTRVVTSNGDGGGYAVGAILRVTDTDGNVTEVNFTGDQLDELRYLGSQLTSARLY